VSEPELHLHEAKKEMELTFTIDEGKRYVVRGLEGVPDVPELARRLSTLVGKPFTPHSTEEVEAAVLDGFREHAHPYVRVSVRPRLNRDEGSAVLVLDLEPGPAAKLGRPVR
jgi:outer membrane protein assembly factor BamA